MARSTRLLLLIALVVQSGLCFCSAAEPFRDGFEGPEISWRVAAGDATFRVERHERRRGQSHSGLWAEAIRISANPGESVFAEYSTPAFRVIAETMASLWVKADRPGLQILGRVALPRTRDATTGKPVTLLVRGSGYTKSGVWQQLRLDDLPRQVERQARVARVNLGRPIDTHEAYLEQILVNVYGGPGITDVAIDDLELSGAVLVAAITSDGVIRASATMTEDQATNGDAGGARGRQRLDARIAGSQLVVNNRPLFPRMIEYRGEPFTMLKSLGFNMARMEQLPTRRQLVEARAAGIWLVSPPPPAADLEPRVADEEPPQIGPELDGIIAWDFCDAWNDQPFDGVRQWAKLVRAADPARRPMLGDRNFGLRSLSRYVEVLFPERFPLGSSLSISDYGKWLSQRQQLARPGTPFWTTIQTDLAPEWQRQWSSLTGQSPPATIQDEQIRQLVYTALAAGARGLSFQGATPLNADDAWSKRRAAILEWLNLELDLVEPWATNGNFLTLAEGSDANLSAVVLQTPQARLIAPVSRSPGSQYVAGVSAGGVALLTVPGGQAADQAFALTAAGMRPLARQRVAGGLRITLSEEDRSSLIVLTQNSAVIGELTKQVAKTRRRAAELERQLALQEVASVESVVRRLPVAQNSAKNTDAELAAARTAIAQCDAQLTRREVQNALLSSRRATQALRRVERGAWERAERPYDSAVASPLAVSFTTLPEHQRFVEQWRVSPLGQNRLAGGDFESLERMRQAGWKNLQYNQTQLATLVEISPDDPREGINCLHLNARPAQPGAAPMIVESAPIQVVSPRIPVELGQLYLIHGWVKVEQAIAGSVDGLMVYDSLGGEALGERFSAANGWREFGFYRVAAQSGDLSVTIELSGIGDAWIDDVQVQSLGAGQFAGRRQ